MDGNLSGAAVQRYGLKEWIIRYSDGKADSDLVQRWINIPVNRGMIHFFHPKITEQHGAPTFFCEYGPVDGSIFKCEAIPRTGFDLGVITSLEQIRSNDQRP